MSNSYFATRPSTAVGMAAFCRRDVVKPLKRHTRAQFARLSAEGQDSYNEIRAEAHRNLPTFRTPQMTGCIDGLWEVHETNPTYRDRLKRAASVDAFPGTGKTTTAGEFQKEIWLHELAKHGRNGSAGDHRIPTFNVSLNAAVTPRTLNLRILRYDGHPAAELARPPNEDRAAVPAGEQIGRSGTVLGVIDEVNFIKPNTEKGTDVGNHLKDLMQELGITLVFVGNDLEGRDFYRDPQISLRVTRLSLAPFTLDPRGWTPGLDAAPAVHRERHRTVGRRATHAAKHERVPLRQDQGQLLRLRLVDQQGVP